MRERLGRRLVVLPSPSVSSNFTGTKDSARVRDVPVTADKTRGSEGTRAKGRYVLRRLSSGISR